ncbi:EAL domain-containing protein [Caenispirillum bisanense]|uniref:PAS domain S-box-containing protein/diguanylate cyclase (GGDEF) domain-containing protein n=1 Tax=Caenispirillum bisanense TaxID=414052 RepID=A0A286G6G5_9PROT|nr:EAL domain-containing protein [Caenispirillum bisanense]SOD90709.1 PAS domain S-box-containing protein/diguanylate cyclase (GGDEF) domain-containing protein [Caenispirillum bisanense]
MNRLQELVRDARLLVVDDNPVNVALLEEMLDDEGYTDVTGVTDPTQAVALFAAQPFDLVLCDIRMPGMDGHEVIRRLRALVGEDAFLPVIVMTAQTDSQTRLQALQAGVRDFITKPFDRTETLYRIRNTLEVELLWRERSDHAEALERLVAERTAELHAREAHLSGILRNAADIIVTADAEGRIRQFNPAAEQTFHIGAAEAAGLPLATFLGEGWTPRVGTLETMARRSDASIFPLEASLATMEIDGAPWVILIGRDVTKRKLAEEEMAFLARHDPITELPNRTALITRLTTMIDEGRGGLALYVAIQGLRRIGDTLGHAVAEKVLRAAGERLEEASGGRAVVGAWGAADFLVLCENMDGVCDYSADSGQDLATALREAIEEPFHVDGNELVLDCRIGVSRFPEHGALAPRVVQRAGLAVFAGRVRGDAGVTVFHAEMEEAIGRRHVLERELRHAVERGQLRLLYQPKIDLASGRVAGMEALVRWQHPELGLVSPAQFIPVAEDTGVIVAIGDWVMTEACRQTRIWHDAGHTDLVVAVNVSGRQFRVHDLTRRVRAAIDGAGLTPSCLEVEITESAVMSDVADAVRMLGEWRDMGASVAIDDFGTGYSSLGTLRQLPLSTLKIDQSFVRHMPDRAADRAVARTIVDLARALDLNVVAEGIETEEHAAVLRDLGCDLGQGYLYARPLPPADFLDFVSGRVPA